MNYQDAFPEHQHTILLNNWINGVSETPQEEIVPVPYLQAPQQLVNVQPVQEENIVNVQAPEQQAIVTNVEPTQEEAEQQ